jgi:hypothetical protein
VWLFIVLLFSWQKSNKKPRKINAIHPQKGWSTPADFSGQRSFSSVYK